MQGDESKARGWVFQSYSRSGKNYRFFVRQGPYKLYANGELYDVPSDWLENHPLTSPETDAVRKRLQSLLDAELKGYAAPAAKPANGAAKGKKTAKGKNK